MRQITLNRQLLGLEDLLFGTGTVTQNRANQVVTITEINAGNLPFDETRTLVEFAQATNLEELGNSVEAINNLNNNLDKLLIVEDTLPIINNVEAIKESIVTLDTNILALQNIDTNMSSINTVEDNLPIINNVEAIKESIVTLDTNILALQNIDTNMSSINTVKDNLPEVVSVAQNIVPNLTEILNVNTLAAQVTQDKSDVSSMKLVVETIYDTFDDRFLGTKIVDPTLDNDGNTLIDGAMYFNTSTNSLRVYDLGTTTWIDIPQLYLSALQDIQLTSLALNQVIYWNGSKWANKTLAKVDVGLSNVDNTSDNVKNVLSATKLANARTINGVPFDGMADITVSDSTAVKLTGNQTLDDIKTYTSSPIVPTPTTDTQVANKVYVDGKYSGFKNYIINGNFDVWQYGTSQTVSGYGSDDRWGNANNGSTKTHSQITCTDTERALFNASKFSRTVVSSVVGASNFVLKQQAIEDITKLAGQTVTLSFWAKADSSKNIEVQMIQTFGSGGSPSTFLNTIGQQLVSLTSTWQKKTITITVPSIIGKTLGTDGVHTTASWLRFTFDAVSGYEGSTVGQQSGTFDIAQVQLEEGSVATTFENRPYGLELSLCQRYARPIPNSFEIAFTGEYTYGGFRYTFSEMRTIPTVTSMGSFIAGGGPNGTPFVNISSNLSLGVTNNSNNWAAGHGISYYGGFLSAEL